MSIYQHFRDEEKVFINHVIGWQSHVQDYYSPKLTSFLDPREQQIVMSVIGQNDECRIAMEGGHENAERKRVLLYPAYMEPGKEDFQLALLEISTNTKFHSLKHSQVLGTLMSLGIDREKFGDILISKGQIQLVLAEEIAAYVIANVEKIGQAGVSLARVDLSRAIETANDWQHASATSSSLRIDAILSSMTSLSRSKAQDFIKGGKVKVNHVLVDQNDFECGQGDLISIRGLGRFQIVEIGGKTKKDNWKLTIGKQKNEN